MTDAISHTFFISAELKETLSPSTPYASLAFSAACTQRLVFSSEARLTVVQTHEELARLLPALIAASGVLYPPDKTIEGKVRQWQVGGGAIGLLPQTIQIAYPGNTTLDKDTGFQGYGPAGVSTQQSKKPRGQELSVGDTFLNHLISSTRVVVENVIAWVKRRQIVQEVLHLTKAGLSDMAMEIACGLHNLRVSCRHPLPTFDVLSLISSG